MDADVLLEIRDITKRFPGTVALNRVRMSVRKGEIHALCGENGAGKSTLMNIIGGVYAPSEGHIFFDGREIAPKNPREAQDMGIGFVHQELSLCPHLSAAENIFIGRLPAKWDAIDFKRLYAEADEILGRFNAGFSSKTIVSQLTVSEQQLVEIGKSMSLNCKLLILDEPTSSLTDKETVKLFEVVRNLKEQGISVLYISHRMAEIFELCERVTVFKDGGYISTMNVTEIRPEDVIKAMVGRELSVLYPPKAQNIDDNSLILQVEKLNSPKFQNISFKLRKGEILGFAGLVGAGRSEIMRGICAIDPIESGEIRLNHEKKSFKNYREAVNAGLCYLTEDRKKTGIFAVMPILDNMISANLKGVSRGIWFDNELARKLVDTYVKSLNIKIPGMDYLISSLSGGNQQKCLVGKWLSVHPLVLIMDEPTRGIDVGAKAEIHNLLRELAASGVGVIIVSSELPEVIGVSDRVAVIHEGDLMGFLEGDALTEENVMMLASGKRMKQEGELYA
ncbi:MAG: sugar ABC transporter ATP-binding protein [Fusobacteriaceae bacterium]|jgi:ribose transport system ATP-binding protein|nr:sugar ABC transporter ATP-binding protein [Fusobacteriaceae bacterium]